MPLVESVTKLPRAMRKELRGIIVSAFGKKGWKHLVNEGITVVDAVRTEDGRETRHLLSATSGDRCTRVSVSNISCWDGFRQETWIIRGVHHH